MSEGSAPSRALPALLAVCLTAGGYGHARAFQEASPSTRPVSAPVAASDVLEKYCVTCHNVRLNTAGLQIDRLDEHDVADNAQAWEKIVTKLRTGEMPPRGRPRPDAATYRAVAAALEAELDAAAAATPHPGRVPVHRLNRIE